MKFSPSQRMVLQMLASCDEPLVYFKGGYWTTPAIYEESQVGKGFHYAATSRSSIGQGQGKLVSDRHPTQYVSMGTIKAMEKMGLLVQTGSSTNYPIEHYPTLSDRVLTEAGLTAAMQGT